MDLPALSPAHAILAACVCALYIDAELGISAHWAEARRRRRLAKYIALRTSSRTDHCLASFAAAAQRHPRRCAIRDSSFCREWSYRETDLLSDHIAFYLLSTLRVQSGHRVAFAMANAPPVWLCILGAIKAGCIVSPHDTDPKGRSLLSCLHMHLTPPSVLIFDAARIHAVRSILPELRAMSVRLVFWSHREDAPGVKEETPAFAVDGTMSEKRLEAAAGAAAGEGAGEAAKVGSTLHEVKSKARLAEVVFETATRNSAGPPHHIVIDHALAISLEAPKDLGFPVPHTHDVVISPLPPSHSTSFISFLMTLSRSGTFVPLSLPLLDVHPSSFWQACADHQATTLFYTHELARLLLSEERTDVEAAHGVQRVAGAGMGAEERDEFHDRFRVRDVVELHLPAWAPPALRRDHTLNLEGTGSVGRFGRMSRWRGLAPALVSVDVQTGALKRDARTRLCVEARIGELGECVVPVPAGRVSEQPVVSGEGRGGREMCRDVFRKGDLWIRTGGLFVRNSNDECWFLGHVGSGFRWKSHYVTTREVENLLGMFSGVQEIHVAGVNIPLTEDRPGMATLVIGDAGKTRPTSEFMADFGRYANKVLPRYAVPVFVHVSKETESWRARNQSGTNGGVVSSIKPTLTAKPTLSALKEQQGLVLGYEHAEYWMPQGLDGVSAKMQFEGAESLSNRSERRFAMPLISDSNLFLVNSLAESLAIFLVAKNIRKQGILGLGMSDSLFLGAAWGFSAVSTFTAWYTGNVSAQKEMAIGHLFYHTWVTSWALFTKNRPDPPSSYIGAAAIHSFLAVDNNLFLANTIAEALAITPFWKAITEKGIRTLGTTETLFIGAAWGFSVIPTFAAWYTGNTSTQKELAVGHLFYHTYAFAWALLSKNKPEYYLSTAALHGFLMIDSTLFLLNTLMEGGVVGLKTLGDVTKAGSVYKVPDGDVLFFLSAVGFSAIPTFTLWRSGNVSGHKEFGLGHLFYHGVVALYLLTKPKKPEAKGPETVIGLVHATLAAGFFNYISK
ncbi:acetyl-CoA synthetase-like protein [Gonapodya prolifera JEL478]|uniref:Acetyl-CoA synthetase-like protein n=1 Tax=Gonapodya prolifera (strain JEL478) TaxID=1344416 RepID=A0A139ARJ5_GONPJ|nr:acetyl-CoA synthetase-like protein [Gonapodya prolifera JEL478]|eukprot:KXS19143.1 acetyl-CoA synthetase-like protein [Gonapodya prolifera JEL478]